VGATDAQVLVTAVLAFVIALHAPPSGRVSPPPSSSSPPSRFGFEPPFGDQVAVDAAVIQRRGAIVVAHGRAIVASTAPSAAAIGDGPVRSPCHEPRAPSAGGDEYHAGKCTDHERRDQKTGKSKH
jgi:hypothetical protein